MNKPKLPPENKFSIEKTPFWALFLLNLISFIIVTLVAILFLTKN